MQDTRSIEVRLACSPQDFAAIGQLLELYQYELSDIWDQELDDHGRYGYDLSRHREAARSFAYLLSIDARPAGFALVAPAAVTTDQGHWMEQFFVLKKHRRSGVGATLARHVLQSHPGAWEIGQMPGNTAARAFWRKLVADFTGGAFEELEITEGGWRGSVQRFGLASPARPC